MSYILLTISAALGQSVKDTIAKALSEKMNSYTLSLGVFISIVVIVLPFVFFTNSWVSNIPIWVYGLIILNGLIFAVSQPMMHYAFKISDLSLTIPILNFSPFFTLLLSPFLLNEFPTSVELLGIFFIVFGAYILKIDREKSGVFEPIKHMFTDKASLLMLGVAFIWGLDTIIAKVGAGQTNPYFWTLATRFTTMLTLIIPVYRVDEKPLQKIVSKWWLFALMGLFVGYSMIAQFFAVLNINATVMTAILRFGSLFSIIIGFYQFKEKNILFRLLGGLIMIFGVTIISLF